MINKFEHSLAIKKIKQIFQQEKQSIFFSKVIELHDISTRCHILTILPDVFFSNYFIEILKKDSNYNLFFS